VNHHAPALKTNSVDHSQFKGHDAMQKITPFLWFDNQAEEAAKFYTSVFSSYGGSASGGTNSKTGTMARFDEAGAKVSGRPPGSVMTASFTLEGQEFVALNGGPLFKFTEAISFVVNCDSQDEVDYFWTRLGEGGDEKAQQCGWLKDKFGVSWQIVPTELPRLLGDRDPQKSKRVMEAMLKMKKIVIADLQRVRDSA
jgi:predicted 3-demethylubiquinone-9 3-methyltransferase (glyoxalase superfamily)